MFDLLYEIQYLRSYEITIHLNSIEKFFIKFEILIPFYLQHFSYNTKIYNSFMIKFDLKFIFLNTLNLFSAGKNE